MKAGILTIIKYLLIAIAGWNLASLMDNWSDFRDKNPHEKWWRFWIRKDIRDE